jgi:NAD dependent epimerase/dehydratase family enzyme
VLLDGQRAMPQRLQELGFAFDFTTLDAALKDLLQ